MRRRHLRLLHAVASIDRGTTTDLGSTLNGENQHGAEAQDLRLREVLDAVVMVATLVCTVVVYFFVGHGVLVEVVDLDPW